jgi:hypothetical protein
MFEIIRKAKPKVRFSLERITRDPLKVPSLTDENLATMGKSINWRSSAFFGKLNLKDRFQHVVFKGGHEFDDASAGAFVEKHLQQPVANVCHRLFSAWRSRRLQAVP